MNPLPLEIDESLPRQQSLPSGRSVVVKVAEGREELEVRSPHGEIEVRIVLTDSGPVVRLSGARLELDAADTVAVHCRRFEVQATEDVQIAAGELRVHTQADIHMDGDYIRLNCADAQSSPPLT